MERGQAVANTARAPTDSGSTTPTESSPTRQSRFGDGAARVREYQPGDWQALRAMHQAQGFDYAFPELSDPIFLSKLVVEIPTWSRPVGTELSAAVGGRQSPPSAGDGAGQVVMASLLRLTAEVYLLHDPRAGTPRQRWQWLLALHRAAAEDAYDRGLADAHCWLLPKIARSFGRRLFRLGWQEQLWPSFSKKL